MVKKLPLLLVLSCAPHAAERAQVPEPTRWERQAERVTIVRDNWGLAHIHGKTDADAVFGMVYAQAEDDFNRVETNYINAMGRLAEAEGEAAIWQDLRMKLFIDPEALKTQYAASPGWLRALMDAWADGLNYYLARHPEDHEHLFIALRSIYEARSTGQSIGTVEEDRKRFERYAAAYTAAGGTQQAMVEQWRRFVNR